MKTYELDGFSNARLRVSAFGRAADGGFGESRESAMVVTVAIRQKWNEEGRSAVAAMFDWIDRVHEYRSPALWGQP